MSKNISSLSEYINIIEELKDNYPSGMVMNNPTSNTFLYRGLSDEKYELLPGLFRKNTDEIEDKKIVNDRYLAWIKEKEILLSFIHQASSILKIPSTDYVRWAEYAQHYGVPTRFLDWSSNPLVALYFACRDNNNSNGKVWLIHKLNYDKFWRINANVDKEELIKETVAKLIDGKKHVDYPKIYTPYYVDERMSAQGSYFMVWGAKEEPFEKMFADEKYKMQIQDKSTGIMVFGEAQQVEFLFEFTIHSDRKQRLLRELDTVGINEKTLFPGLDGIGRYIERRYRFDYNEAVEELV